MQGCSARALARSEAGGQFARQLITYAPLETGLASKPGKRSPRNWRRPTKRNRRSSPHAEQAPTCISGLLQQSCNRTHIGYMPYSLDAILPLPKDAIKGDIFILCPTTGQPVPTGLHTDTVVFHTLPKIEMRMRCPACHKNHSWNCTRAWVIESPPPS